MPNAQKAQVKIGTINTLGVQLDDLREAAEKESLRLEGYLRAIDDFEKGVSSVSESLNEELKETEFAGYIGEPLKVAELVKRYLTRVMGSADNLKVRAQKLRLVQEGQVLGLNKAIKSAKKMMDEEAAKIPSNGSNGSDIISQNDIASDTGRPNASAAEDLNQRRAKAKAAKKASEEAKAEPEKSEEAKAEPEKSKKSRKSRKRRCGNCRKPGHTARSCPETRGM